MLSAARPALSFSLRYFSCQPWPIKATPVTKSSEMAASTNPPTDARAALRTTNEVPAHTTASQALRTGSIQR